MCWYHILLQSFALGSDMSLASGIFAGGVGFIPQVAIALVVWYGGTLVIAGDMTVGILTSFMLYTVTVATVPPCSHYVK
jgi:ATP-binding cassette subfamily B protein